jgi:hypothetical protein
MTLALQLFKNSNDTRGKLRLNFHSLSVSELLEYERESCSSLKYFLQTFQNIEFTHAKFLL